MRGITFSEFGNGQNVDMFLHVSTRKLGNHARSNFNCKGNKRKIYPKTFMYGVIIVYNTCIPSSHAGF